MDISKLKAAAEKARWGDWSAYKPHSGARGYEVRVGSEAVAQHCLKDDAAFIAEASPKAVLCLIAALEAAQKRNSELERSELQLIAERDNAEEALGNMYQAVIGELPKWSNCFGYVDAVATVTEHLADEHDSEMKWRDLALQFDGHRMQAICFLKQILKETPETEFLSAREFLKAGPLSGEEVLRNRIAELGARTVKLPSLNPQMFNDDVMFGYRKAQREAVEFCAAAGINLETGGE